jgi:hypothetical protein
MPMTAAEANARAALRLSMVMNGDPLKEGEKVDDQGVTEIVLTPREVAIAKYAAKLAVKEMEDSFYKSVGQTIVKKWLVLIGAAFVAYAAGRGWIKFPQ